MHLPKALRGRRWIVDLLFLLALGMFALLGVPLASFHGDEAMLIYMSSDYATAFIDGNPDALKVTPPYYIDQDNWLRILNGSVTRYAIGVSWHLAGYTREALPPRPGWDWGLDYDTNVATNHRPPNALLHLSRLHSALFFAASIAAMFGIGWQLGAPLGSARPLAYLASLLYALHPALLLNARRAMMEGPVLCFGLLTLLVALVLVRRLDGADGRRQLALFALLALCGALTLSSKHSGALFVAGAFGGVWVAELLRAVTARSGLRGVGLVTLGLGSSGLLALGLFIALSPALWNDPPARLGDLLQQRAGLLDIQVAAYGTGGMPAAQRLEQLVVQPFITPAQHFEVAHWADYPQISAEVSAYTASPLAGVQFGLLLGLPLTLLAGWGLVALLLPRLRPPAPQAAVLLVWAGGTFAGLLANPLPWQRYYLPWIPITILLAAFGALALARTLAQFRQRTRTKQQAAPLAS